MPFYIDALANSTILAWPGKYLSNHNSAAPIYKSAFIAVTTQELAAARNLQNAWLSYQTVIEDQVAFSKSFVKAERLLTHRFVVQLEEIHAELSAINVSIFAVEGEDVPVELQANLDYARCAVARLRADVFDCHWNYKINWSLHVSKTGTISLVKVVKPTVEQYLSHVGGADYWEIFTHVTRSGRQW